MINTKGQVRMIKFGFAKNYIENGVHIELERYNSILLNEEDHERDELTPWQKQGYNQSRRDDIWMLCNIFI